MRASLCWAARLCAFAALCLSGCAADDPLHDAVPSGTGGSIGQRPPEPCAEGDIRSCKIDLPTQGDVIHCIYGVERCVDGRWDACEVPGPDDALLPEPSPCTDGATRKCYVQLPTQGTITNCYYGHETCDEGAWGPCTDGAISAIEQGAEDAAGEQGPGSMPLSLSTPTLCEDDPCNPSCHVYDELPPAGVTLPGEPITPWESGSFSSVSSLPGFAIKAQRTPCGSASDCQANHFCSLPITRASEHDKCAPGPALSDTKGDDPCVDAICARHPTCCVTQSGTCAHDRCTTGAALNGSCDLCVSAICAQRPGCCAGWGAWDASCVALVGTVCGLTCNQWDDGCVAQVHDTCGAFCTALPATAPPAKCEHDKCYTGSKISQGCADPCVATICAHPVYARCCDNAWDESCVNAVNSVCGQTCAPKGQCIPWLGAQTDPFCPSRPDLTLGVPCNSKVVVCNVGGAPAIGPIQVVSAQATSLTMPSCTPSGSALACPPLEQDIAPGQCVNLDCPGLATGAGEELMVNANGAVTECVSTPGQASCVGANTNNWSLSGTSGTCEPPICTGSLQSSQVKTPNFHFLVERSTASALPAAKWPGIINGLGNYLASAGAAGVRAAVQFFPDGPPWIPGSCDAATCLGAASPMFPYGPVANCGVRPLPSFGLQNLPNAVFSANVKAVTVGAGLAPTPMAYAGAVNIARTYGGDRNIVLVLTSDITTCDAQVFTSVNSLAGQASSALVSFKIKTWVISVGLVGALYDPIARAGGTNGVITVPVGDDVALTQAITAIKTNYFSCSFPLPPPSLFDKAHPKVELKNAVGAVVSTFTQVNDAGSCLPASTAHFYYDDNAQPTKLVLCPATCSAVRANIGYAIKITLSCPGNFDDATYSEVYTGECPYGSHVSWGFLTFDTQQPPSTSTVFRARSAADLADLPSAPLHELITAQAGVPDTQVCSMAGPAPCPIDLYDALGGSPEARNEHLELVLEMHTNVSHSKTPTINDWQITYSCIDDE
jgi:hypothetical protein